MTASAPGPTQPYPKGVRGAPGSPVTDPARGWEEVEAMEEALYDTLFGQQTRPVNRRFAIREALKTAYAAGLSVCDPSCRDTIDGREYGRGIAAGQSAGYTDGYRSGTRDGQAAERARCAAAVDVFTSCVKHVNQMGSCPACDRAGDMVWRIKAAILEPR